MQIKDEHLAIITSEDSEVDSYTYEELEDRFSDELDEIYEPVELGFITVYPSSIKDLDPIVFRCALLDKLDQDYEEITVNGVAMYYDKQELEDYIDELERLDEDNESEDE